MSQRPELVIGFVGPIGVRLTDLVQTTSNHLSRGFNYRPAEIRLSHLLERYSGWKPPSEDGEYARITHGQTTGHEFRERVQDAAALALGTLVAIREKRMEYSGSADKPADATVFLLNQLKHPKEVLLLRQIYGSSFVLIAAHASPETRLRNLATQIANSESRSVNDDDKAKAAELIRIDDLEVGPSGDDELGQNTRNTYPLADLFVDAEQHSCGSTIERFIDLLFGHPFGTPRPDEVAMYHASAAALRSSDESRQVGAVIASVKHDGNFSISNIDIIATGVNEVPMRGGGFYWDGSQMSPDARDQWLVAYRSDDRALAIKKGVLSELLEVLKAKKWFKDPISTAQIPDLVKELIPDGLKGTQFLNLSEFQRQVHAEMAALLDGARRGVSVDGHTMFVTTFPCHNCAKHIIAAGIKHVIYLEPYPKSRAEMLHNEEIDLESKPGVSAGIVNGSPKVVFLPYTGVAPRQYQRLFNMAERGRKSGGLSLKQWGLSKATLSPHHLVRNAYASYVLAEREELARLSTNVFSWNPDHVCPQR